MKLENSAKTEKYNHSDGLITSQMPMSNAGSHYFAQ